MTAMIRGGLHATLELHFYQNSPNPRAETDTGRAKTLRDFWEGLIATRPGAM